MTVFWNRIEVGPAMDTATFEVQYLPSGSAHWFGYPPRSLFWHLFDRVFFWMQDIRSRSMKYTAPRRIRAGRYYFTDPTK